MEHELAHVRRHDYAVNVLQTLIEGLLFYHPAVWWLSSRIRHERELCCDQAAIARCGDRVVYSRALLELEQMRAGFALAATGGRLSDRIGRILGMEQKTIFLAPALTAAAVLALWTGLAWAQKEPVSPTPPSPPAPAASPAPPDTVTIDGKVYRRKHVVAPPSRPFPPHQPPAPPTPELREIDRQMRALEKQLQELALRRKLLEQQSAGLALEAKNLERQKFEYEQQLAKMSQQADRQAKLAERAEAEAKVAQLLARQKEMEVERRIRYADERFAQDGKRGSETDRGKVYLKYGPPDEIETHPSEGKDAWLYRNGPIIRFVNGKLVSIEAAI
jgi:GWxTD domain-containing protein